ncbi:MAG: hypothetical protein R6V12_05340, partial [Candidatus Hydrogenedentota bacterium]
MLSHGLILFLVSAAIAQAGSVNTEPRANSVLHTKGDTSTKAFPSPGDERSNVRLSTHGKTWYAHVESQHKGAIELKFVRPPDSLMLLDSGEPLPFQTAENGTAVQFTVPQEKRTTPETVVAATWNLERWEQAVQTMEDNAPKAPPKPILFVGSSSIRGWDVPRYFPDLPVWNHGFGGSEYFDALCYANRIIFPFQPRAVVLYDGDNDIARGKSAEWVLADMKALVRVIHHALPETPIIVLSIKTSLSRWDMHEEMEKANELMG